MKALVLAASVCLASAAALALPDYEPFANATGSGGTAYTTGANLIGQTDAAGLSWYQAGAGGSPQPAIAAGDLSVSGLYSAGGGQSAAFGGSGTSARLNMSVPAGGITAGTVYFSFAMKLTDLSALTTGGTFWAGFNNAQGSQTSTPGTVVTRVQTRSATGGFNIGLQEGSQTATLGNLVWSPTLFTTADTIFLVGSYTFGAGTGDDSSQLWVNPDSSTFGAAAAPGGALLSSGGTDIARVASFVLYDRAANEPSGVIDDLRMGLNWADVTPQVPEPSALLLGALGLTALCMRRLRHR